VAFLSFLRPEKKSTIEAQYKPQVMGDGFSYYNPFTLTSVTRSEAMSVPAVARCRNLITGVIATMPLNLYKKSTGEELGSPVWLEQPSISQPRSVTLAATVDALLMYGVAFWQCKEVYFDDGRPARFEWIANHRVSQSLDRSSTFVEGYTVDGNPVPMDGLNSLITFQGLDEGILSRGARTIKAAIDLERATQIATSTPMPSGVLRNNGADMSESEVQGILAAWKQARLNRSTAYLSANLEYSPTAFTPKDMTYNESAQYLATQIARVCNIPAYYISADMNNSMTYANVQDERRQFVSLSLAPFIAAIEDRLSMDDITARGNYVKFDLDSTFLRADAMQRLNVIEKMLNLGLIDVNQAMEMEDLTPNGSNNDSNL
jgi:HK97 family phage portal protein